MKTQQDTQYSTIAELVFLEAPAMNFARLVADLDTVLGRFPKLERQLTWDNEDIASFDMPGTRIVLATNETPRPGIAVSLTISVGPSHLPAARGRAKRHDVPLFRHDAMCSRLVERVQTRLTPDAIFWHECAVTVGPDLIDALSAALPAVGPRHGVDHPIFQTLKEITVDDIYIRGFMRGGHRASNDHPHIPRIRDYELSRLRAALYPKDEEDTERASPQMRLAAHTMNATLIMVALPVGAAMLTYSLLRGDNMRLTSAALVATGLGSTILQSQFGQQLVALAGS